MVSASPGPRDVRCSWRYAVAHPGVTEGRAADGGARGTFGCEGVVDGVMDFVASWLAEAAGTLAASPGLAGLSSTQRGLLRDLAATVRSLSRPERARLASLAAMAREAVLSGVGAGTERAMLRLRTRLRGLKPVPVKPSLS